MTLTQFQRMKPKYRVRLLIVAAVVLMLFIGILYAISFGVSAIRMQLNTTQLKEVTAASVLEKPSLIEIFDIIKPNTNESVFVLDSHLTCDDAGKVTELEMHLANLVDEKQTDYWVLTANKDKVKLRKEDTEYDNMKSLQRRKVELKNYYPALSRIPVSYLKSNSPVGKGGSYEFTDAFDNNRSPEFAKKLTHGLTGLWVSETGAVSSFSDTFVPPSLCAPTVVTVHEVDPNNKKRKTVLLPPKEKYVMLMKCAPYAS